MYRTGESQVITSTLTSTYSITPNLSRASQ